MSNKKNFEIFTENSTPSVSQQELEKFSKGVDSKKEGIFCTPWEQLNPRDKSTFGINLRLNEYEISLLRFVAEQEDRSQQKIIKKLLIPVLKKTAEIYFNENSTLKN